MGFGAGRDKCGWKPGQALAWPTFGCAPAGLWRQAASQHPATPQLRAASLSDSPLEGAEFEPSCATDSRRAAESWDRHRPVDGRQVHVTASRPALSGLASFPAQYTARIAGIDLFVVPTIGLKLLYGLVILGLQRRRLVWTNVTANPTAEGSPSRSPKHSHGMRHRATSSVTATPRMAPRLAWWSESRGPSCRGGGMACWNRRAVSLSARADRRHGGLCLRPAISLSLWFLWRAQNATYRGSGYSKSAGDVRSLHSCPKRRANEICCPFGNLLNPPDLVIADARRLAWR